MAEKCPECLGIGKISARNYVKCGGSGELIIHSHPHNHGDSGEHHHLHPHPTGHALLKTCPHDHEHTC